MGAVGFPIPTYVPAAYVVTEPAPDLTVCHDDLSGIGGLAYLDVVPAEPEWVESVRVYLGLDGWRTLRAECDAAIAWLERCAANEAQRGRDGRDGR